MGVIQKWPYYRRPANVICLINCFAIFYSFFSSLFGLCVLRHGRCKCGLTIFRKIYRKVPGYSIDTTVYCAGAGIVQVCAVCSIIGSTRTVPVPALRSTQCDSNTAQYHTAAIVNCTVRTVRTGTCSAVEL
jgi:hypothetical protein